MTMVIIKIVVDVFQINDDLCYNRH